MSRAARLLDLLQALRNRSTPVSGQDLAAELGISIRTLYRDIATLQGRGADIQGEPGTGYVLRPGFTLPPLMFSADEIEALVLGSRWVAARSSDSRLSSSAEQALSKITSVLPADLRDRVEATNLLVPQSTNADSIDAAEIRLAIRDERKITIGYRSLEEVVSSRTIWPFLIGFSRRPVSSPAGASCGRIIAISASTGLKPSNASPSAIPNAGPSCCGNGGPFTRPSEADRHCRKLTVAAPKVTSIKRRRSL